MPEELEQKILDKIKSGSLIPKPRWHFLLKERFIWTIGVLALLIGAAAVSVMIYLAQSNDLWLYDQAGSNFGTWLLLSLPYFWLLFLGLFVWLLYYNLKHTKRGYRYPTLLIVGAAILASIFLGGVFYACGVGAKIDDILGRQAPLYDRVFNPHVGAWSRPEEGRIAGLIVSKPDQEHFILVDRERGEWTVIYKTDDDNLVVLGQPVRVIGKISSERTFKAKKILELGPGREFFQRFKPTAMMPPPLPAREINSGGQGCACSNNSFSDFLNQYPEFKSMFEQDLLLHRDIIKEIDNNNSDFLPSLHGLGLSNEVWQTLSAQ